MMSTNLHWQGMGFPLLQSVWTLLIFLICANPALSAILIYHSPNDDGLSGSSTIASGGVQTVYLYIDGGTIPSSPGRACHDGLGDEVCGYDLELTGLNGLTLSSFNPDPSANLLINVSAASVRLNGLDTQSPTPGPHRIGELQVVAGAGGELQLTSGEVVGANLGSEVLAAATLAIVPEPHGSFLMGSGVGLLAVLARRRMKA